MDQLGIRVKVIAATGISPAKAIVAALDLSIQEFADRYGLNRAAVSMCIHGRQRLERVRDALALELGVDREWVDHLLDADHFRQVG